MSLATSIGGGGGGLGGGGLSMSTMAHGGPSAMATHQQMQPPPGTGTGIPGMTSTTAPPVSAAALGADLLDKNQGSLDKRQIRNVASMPIIAIDLYGERGDVASFPSVENIQDKDEQESPKLLCQTLGQLGNSGNITLKRNNDTSYRAVKRVLTKGKGYNALFQDAMTKGNDKESSVVVMETPHLLLGSRKVDQIRPVVKAKYNVDDDDDNNNNGTASAIAPSSTKDDNGSGVTIRNGTLDGLSAPQGDDFDRVNLQVNLHSSKKALTLLPEDAVSLLIAKAKSMMSSTMEEDEEAYLEYPPAIAVPAWACRDTTMESLLDACNNNAACVYNRSVAALAGALLPHVSKKDPKNKTKQQEFVIHNVIKTLIQRFQSHEKKREDMANKGEENARSGETFMPLVVVAGMTPHGIELSAIQVGGLMYPSNVDEHHSMFGDLKVISNVSYQFDTTADDNNKVTHKTIHKALVELSEVVDDIYPELEEDGGIVTMLTYGSIQSQLKMKSALEASIQKINQDEPDDVWNDKVSFTSSREEAVALGTAILAASSHARIRTMTNDGDAKTRPGLMVQNVAPNAVGISLCLEDNDDNWTPPKVIFEYDRLVPAGPHAIELCASECVALQKDLNIWNDTEKLVDEGEKWNTGKHIAERETAARSLRLRIVQQQERGGKWIPVGNILKPLTISDSQADTNDDGTDNETDRIAIESAVLELSLSPTGVITSSLTSDGHSIVQATKNARSNVMWYYLKWIIAIGFFGGFLVKSYVEEKVFERDVVRLLTYYKHVVPNSIADGDLNNARYLVWKYKGKKDKLWKRLEAKYDAPVLHAHEWPEPEEEPEEEEEQNLDDQPEPKQEDEL
jgi:hypothetical protein